VLRWCRHHWLGDIYYRREVDFCVWGATAFGVSWDRFTKPFGGKNWYTLYRENCSEAFSETAPRFLSLKGRGVGRTKSSYISEEGILDCGFMHFTNSINYQGVVGVVKQISLFCVLNKTMWYICISIAFGTIKFISFAGYQFENLRFILSALQATINKIVDLLGKVGNTF